MIGNLTWTIEGPDGNLERSASDCGQEPSPSSNGPSAAARWTPNEPGDYTVALTADWGGTWTRTYRAFSRTFDLGIVPVAYDAITYPVVETQTVGKG